MQVENSDGHQGERKVIEINSFPGIAIGHAQHPEVATGTTVVLLEKPCTTAFEARGGWPGTYDASSVDPGRAFYKKEVIFLTGGDVYGFDAATGIRRYLVEKGRVRAGFGETPGIVGTNIYDLEVAKGFENVSYEQLGYLACLNAKNGAPEMGSVGAGVGATVGKLRGMRYCFKGGFGFYAFKLGSALFCAAVVTNALGNIVDPESGKVIAGTRRSADPKDGFVELREIAAEYLERRGESGVSSAFRSTTIGVVVTNVSLSHEAMYKVAQMAHDGLARVIRPVHMMADGDTIFAVSTSQLELSSEHYSLVDVVGEMCAEAVERAVIRAVKSAKSVAGIPALSF